MNFTHFILRRLLHSLMPFLLLAGAGSNALAQSGLMESGQEHFITGTAGNRPSGKGPDSSSLVAAENNGADWLYHTRDYAGTRFSPLEQINRQNVSNLQATCLYQVGGDAYFQAGPLVYDGTLYLTAGARTLAINASDCSLVWSHDWEYQDQVRVTTNRGVAIKDGYVVRGTADGYLMALDSADGKLLWARQVADPAEGEHFTMAPLIYKDLILIGPAGGAYGISGWIGAFKLDDGSQVWRFHTVPGATATEGSSWGNPLGIKIGGGAVWTPLSLDVDSESLYVAITNPAPDFPADLRPGDNLYTNSVLSLNVINGELDWYRQLLPADDHGWDLTQVSPLYTAEIGGEQRKLVTTVGKDGVLRVLDRNTTEPVFQAEVSLQKNTEAPVTTTGTYSCPGVLGGVLWNGSALDRNSTVLVTPSVNLCSTFYRALETRYVEGKEYFGGTVVSDPDTMSGWITAVDATNGKLQWKYESEFPVVAAVTTTAGGLVLAGETNGNFIALDSGTGERLYRFNTGGAIGGGIISYAVEGKQYIAVASGRPSPTQVNGEMGSPTLVVFALPEQND